MPSLRAEGSKPGGLKLVHMPPFRVMSFVSRRAVAFFMLLAAEKVDNGVPTQIIALVPLFSSLHVTCIRSASNHLHADAQYNTNFDSNIQLVKSSYHHVVGRL